MRRNVLSLLVISAALILAMASADTSATDAGSTATDSGSGGTDATRRDTNTSGTDSYVPPRDAGGETVPPGWNCEPSYYGTADGCDCGCGEHDPDCEGSDCTEPSCTPTEDMVCEFCYDADGAGIYCDPCGQCVDTACATQIDTCVASDTCGAQFVCICGDDITCSSGCNGDATCITACETDNPDDGSAAALVACIDTCADSCN